jgi:hypothetical protein
LRADPDPGLTTSRQIDQEKPLIEWLIQVVAVAWMGAMFVTLLKVVDDAGALPADGRDRDLLRPIRSKARAHRGNARELRA